ncbi:MAG: hypothetical protein LBH28_03560, partial [Oscillospiraceae bacterium]|nr:hypothetical protein [Oscillospiraceae bacterium]
MKKRIFCFVFAVVLLAVFAPNAFAGDADQGGVRVVSAGYYHTAVITTDGSLWAWGNNVYGQLGDGTTTDRSVPTRIGTSNDWIAVSAGFWHTVAVKTDGSLWTWGRNFYAQLGDGTRTDCSVPARIGMSNDWTAVYAGGNHTIATKTDGSHWAWGYNGVGQLGDGTTIRRSVPTRIGVDNDWTAVSAGNNHTSAIKTNGSLWAWGSNNVGELGDGTTIRRNVPTQIGTGNDWATVSVGGGHTVAIKTNGSLWAWGLNDYGQLGDGTDTNRLEPVLIIGPTQTQTDTLTFTVESKTARPGKYIEVPILISNNPGITGITRLQISWDPDKLMYDDRLGTYDTNDEQTWPFILGDIFDGSIFVPPAEGRSKTDSYIRFAFVSMENSTENGALLILKFKVKEGVEPGDIDLSLALELVEDEDGLEVPFKLIDGWIT